MITRTIKNTDLFRIENESAKSVAYGFDQEWYRIKWHRSAGCGPTVASMLIYYIRHSPSGASKQKNFRMTKDASLQLMEEVWNYVTPSLQGVNTTKMLYEGVLEYAKSKGLDLEYDVIDIPRKKSLRPPFARLLSFIGESLDEDCPVAFLNLHNGEEKQLYSWHWVTIISLEHLEDGSTAFATILDEGLIKKDRSCAVVLHDQVRRRSGPVQTKSLG